MIQNRLVRLEKLSIFLLSLLVAAGAFAFLLSHAGSIIMNTDGDGGKNYYNYLYYCLYGKGLWFEGMNYPYGEHILFPDLQPLLSVPFTYLRDTFSLTYEDALALMHVSIIFSFGLALYFNTRILRLLQLPLAWAFPLAICISFLSPQLLRMSGHFALAYPSFTPMLFYYTLQYHRQAFWRYPVYILLLSLVVFFLHPYYVALTMVWTLSYTLVFMLGPMRRLGQKAKHVAPLLFMVLLLIFSVQLFTSLTDPITDRPNYPYGALAYASTGEHLFTSAYSPFWNTLKQWGCMDYVCEGGEGYGYLGLLSLLVLVTTMLSIAIRKISKQKALPFSIENFDARQWLWMALLLLLAGMGVPFVWGMEGLLDYLSVFRQFRSLGRFIWMFYQIIGITCAYILYRFYAYQREKKLTYAWLFMLLPLSLGGVEVVGYLAHVQGMAIVGRESYRSFHIDSDREWQRVATEHAINTKDYQAIILLPYIHVGSDKWSCNGASIGLLPYAYRAALYTYLPIVDVMMARTSWSQTARQVKLSSGLYGTHPIFDTCSDKPFLLLRVKTEPVKPDEAYLMAASEHLGDMGALELWRLDPVKLKTQRDSALRFIHNVADNLSQADTMLAAESPELIYQNHLDERNGFTRFYGEGALSAIRSKDSLLLELPVQVSTDNRLYEISTWVLMSEKDYRTPVLNLSLLDEQGNEIYRQDAVGKESFDNKGMWFRLHLYFKIPIACRKLRWHIYNDAQKSYLALDEIQIRPADAVWISKSKEAKLMVNNHLLE